LRDTFPHTLVYKVPFKFENRFAHHFIRARSGAGKTNYINAQILEDLKLVVSSVDEYSPIVGIENSLVGIPA
jgi:hypothetical protein